MMFSGAAVARPLLDPGAAVRWGLPLALAVHNVAVATVVGALVFAVVILPRDAAARRTGSSSHQHPAAPGAEHPAFSRVMTLASVAAVVWTIAAVAVLVLTYADVSGQSISGSSNYTASLIYFVSNFPTGQAWLAVTIFAAVVTTLCFGVRNLAALAVTLVLAMLGMMPQALIGHSSSSNDHEGAVNSLALHIAGVALWFGGIVALAVVSPKLGKLTGPVLKRFSTLALFGFVVVTASGVVNASIRVTSWHQLFTSAYGQLIMAKTVAVLVLGAIGYMHRQWIIPRLTRNTANTAGTAKATFSTRRVLWQLIAAEVLLMGVTSGIAVALSRSAPPEPTTFSPDATPAFILSGYELPPPLEFSRWFTEWRVDWLWLTFVLGTSVAYILGFIKLRRRGDSWPVIRMISWLVGMVALFYITSGGPSVYGLVLFSAHMVDHMALMVVAPLFMVMGAPISLALKALTPRRDGSRGVREWILAIVHSRFSAVVTHPLFAAANFACQRGWVVRSVRSYW
ncbi:MAG: bifunctional copper resistance protein CopD/cytochrome c oxidase assembly protein, partial [Acidobacteria bacterium]|nr:bifunctional copper resistance protein CopD/cytochrome c oxidase assembly protein [Acidobacteriota bacterium]